MGIGFIISMVVAGIIMMLIMMVVIPMERKYIVRKSNRKIDLKASKILYRWNVFDTMSVSLAIYTIICVQILNLLVTGGQTIENPYVQFFTNQGQVWVIVSSAYLISRLSLVLKGVKEFIKDGD
ncbi:group-specific protein [Cytobacillus purgationiresistens]|uniref:H+/gluconate symporter-like permease n=1 Tax=Cytobacillus purgationiresistens TaxID=863449 RepID=A0ABU0APK5_9BACI|nr:group-specific protein [Cytobacillus purgationiresistens]MDQ0273222.1 H+/gluconate symporter-like permease [Cytobacillus purgationiresistens]